MIEGPSGTGQRILVRYWNVQYDDGDWGKLYRRKMENFVKSMQDGSVRKTEAGGPRGVGVDIAGFRGDLTSFFIRLLGISDAAD